jgi:hypothetical protein
MIPVKAVIFVVRETLYFSKIVYQYAKRRAFINKQVDNFRKQGDEIARKKGK